MEKYCCDVVIERVTPTMSYGNLESVKVSLDGVKADALQVREAATKQDNSKNLEEKQEPADKARPTRKSGESGKSPTAGATSSEGGQSVVKGKDW
jgi:hypothetical protein